MLQNNKFYINNKSDDITLFITKLINFYSPNNNAGFKKRKAAKHDSSVDNNRFEIFFGLLAIVKNNKFRLFLNFVSLIQCFKNCLFH